MPCSCLKSACAALAAHVPSLCYISPCCTLKSQSSQPQQASMMHLESPPQCFDATGEPAQRKPLRQQGQTEPIRFKGVLRDRHTTQDGCEYVRITLEPTGSSFALNVIDAEFLFPSGAPCCCCNCSACSGWSWPAAGSRSISLGGVDVLSPLVKTAANRHNSEDYLS